MISESTFTVRAHGVHSAFAAMVEGLKKRKDIEVKVNSFDPFDPADIIHVQTLGPYGLAMLLFGKGKKIVSVHIVPDSLIGSFVGAEYWLPAGVSYLKFFYSKADRLLAVSDEVKQTLKNKLHLKKPIAVLPNMADIDKYQTTKKIKKEVRLKLGLGEKDFVVVGCGQVTPRKRYDSFVNLARKLKEFKFIWIGGITFKHLSDEYYKMARLMRKAPKNMTTTGVIELPEVKKYYQAADVFILPSVHEGHPMAVIEAAAAGLPVIVRDIPHYQSSFSGNVLRGTDRTFVKIIQRLAADRNFYQQWVNKAQIIAKKCSLKEGIPKLIKIYRKALKG